MDAPGRDWVDLRFIDRDAARGGHGRAAPTDLKPVVSVIGHFSFVMGWG